MDIGMVHFHGGKYKCGTAYIRQLPTMVYASLFTRPSLSLVSHCYEKQMTTREMTMTIIMDYKLKISKSSEVAHT